MTRAVFTDRCAALSTMKAGCGSCGRTGATVDVLKGDMRTGYEVRFEDGLNTWADRTELEAS